MNVSANKLARRLAAALVSLFAVVVLALPAAAAPQVDKTTPVNDYAGILSRDTIAYVTEISSALQSTCGAEIGVYTTEYIGNSTMEGYAYSVLNEWGLGSSDRDNGALLNVGSCAGLMPAGPYMAAYYATKAYVVSLTSAVAEELREMHSPVYVGCLCPGPVNTEFNAVANVQFALKGITPEFCVRCALHGIHRRKTIIVPGPLVAAGMTLGRYLPRSAYIKIAAHQQQKKLYR